MALISHMGGSSSLLQTAEVTQNATDARYSLSGTVVNSVTGEPIRRALVQCYFSGEQVVFTDDQGHFEFHGLPLGTSSLLARKPGFFNPQDVSEGDGFDSAMVQTGPDTGPVLLKLAPEAVIFGRVRRGNGEPIEQIPIQVTRNHVVDGRRQSDQMGFAHTDEDGNFRIANLLPGRYYVAVGPTTWPVTWIQAAGSNAKQAGYRRIFFPAAPDIASATAIDLSAGQQVEADFSLSPEPIYRVTGSMLGLPENPSASLQIIDQSSDWNSGLAFDNQSGKFVANVPAGSYRIQAHASLNLHPAVAGASSDSNAVTVSPAPAQIMTLFGEVPVVVHSDLSGVILPLAPSPSIPIQVKIERTQGAATSTPPFITVNGRNTRQWNNRVSVLFRRESLRNQDPNPIASWDGQSPSVSINPGTYRAELSPQGNFYVQSARMGDKDLLRDPIVVGAGGEMPPLEIVLRDDGGQISGKILSGDFVRRAMVLMVPDAAPSDIKLVMAGETGEFGMMNLAPGDYSVIALDNMRGVEFRNPEVLAPYLTSSTRVHVQPGGEAKITVNLIRTDK